MALLDDIANEVSQLTDEQIAEAANAILARKAKEKGRMTPDRVQKMKDREKARRTRNQEILKLARAKGIVPPAPPRTQFGRPVEATSTE